MSEYSAIKNADGSWTPTVDGRVLGEAAFGCEWSAKGYAAAADKRGGAPEYWPCTAGGPPGSRCAGRYAAEYL